MKRLIGLISILSFLLTGCEDEESTPPNSTLESHDTSEEITIFYFDNPPHIYIDENGRLTGAVYDFIEEGIAPEMGVKFNWNRESTAIPRQIEIIKSDRNAAIALLSKSEDRAKIMAFTETPYFEESSALALLKTNPLNEINDIDDLVNLRIGYAKGGFLTPLMNNKILKFDLISTSGYHLTNIKRLNLGRIDAVFAPGSLSLIFNIQKLNLGDRIKLLELPDVKTSYYIIFSKMASEQVQKYNAAFKKIDGKRFYLQKLKKYIEIDLLE